MKLVLDTNVLLRRPEILSRKAPGVSFALLPHVIEQLGRSTQAHRSLRAIIDLINAAVLGGTAEIVELEELVGSSANAIADNVDSLLVDLLKAYDKRGIEAVLVTDDGQLRHAARDFGYRTSTIDQAFALLEERHAVSAADINAKAEGAKQASRRYTWTSFASGIAVAALGNWVYEHIDQIVRTINVWGTVTSLPMLGLLFFWIRSRFRLAYGVIECAVGVLTAIRVFLPSFNYESLEGVEILQILGGLYIMVRGLDNIGRGLVGTRLQPLWQRAFPES